MERNVIGGLKRKGKGASNFTGLSKNYPIAYMALYEYASRRSRRKRFKKLAGHRLRLGWRFKARTGEALSVSPVLVV